MVNRPSLTAVATLAVLLAACGGASPATTPTGAAQTAAATPAPSQQASDQPIPTDAATPAATGGTTTGDDICLVTAAEAGQILGVVGVAAGSAYTGSTACSYVAAGDPVGLSQLNPDGREFFELIRDSEGVQAVDGLGVEAFFDPSSATLGVLKGNASYTIVAGTGADAEAQRLAWAKQFATIALTRMP